MLKWTRHLFFILGALCITCVSVHAQTIGVRASSTATATTSGVFFVAAGTVGSANGGNVSVPLPAGIVANDILILVADSGDNATSTTAPTGWALLRNSYNTTANQGIIFWRRASGADTQPTVVHNLGGANNIIARIYAFRGVDTTTAFDVANSMTNSGADFTTEAAAITTVTNNVLLLFAAMIADNRTGINAPTGGMPTWNSAGLSATANGNDSAIALFYGLTGIPGAQNALSATSSGGVAVVSTGAQIALRPKLFTINKPAGTAQDDVMIATIAVRAPGLSIVIPPSGWTLVRRTDNSTNVNSLLVYSKVATNAEPASYDWNIAAGSGTSASAVSGVAGSIVSFINVDTVTPIDVQAGQSTASSATHITPAVTTTVSDTMVLALFEYGASGVWSTPAGMTSQVNVSSVAPPSASGISLGVFSVTQASIGSTGTKTSTALGGNAQVGATGILALRPRVDHFAITLSNSPSTCTAATLTISAQDKNNNTVTNYTGTINLSTSPAHGTWGAGTLPTPSGTLTNGGSDTGAATYAFVATDSGIVNLTLTDVHDDSLVITVADSTRASTSTSSGAIQFQGNFFQIATDPIQVAGRPQAMTAILRQGASCLNTLTIYPNGNHALKAWFTPDMDHPSSANAPAIAGGSPAITTSAPVTNNVTLNFTNGVAPFTLSTSDIGKYVINLRDDSQSFASNTINGASSTITTRPFALIVSGIKQGALNNPAGTATTGGKFIAAGDAFQATVGTYLWNAAADSNVAGGDGIPDTGATLAQITGAGAVPSYTWSTSLSAAAPFTPAGAFTLSNGALSGACPANSPNCFTNGIATPSNLVYPEVGSFTLSAIATNFLNSGITLTGIVFDNSATPTRNAIVGRFYPDHFTLTASSILAACAAGGFTYMDQPKLSISFTIAARNKADNTASNYNSATYSAGTVSMVAENNNNGVDLSTRLSAATGTWAAGIFSFSSSSNTFSRLAAPDGPYEALQIGIKVTDMDGPVITSRDMDPTTSTVCTSVTCTGKAIGAATKVRFGRVRTANAAGSELLPLPMFLRAEYWSNGFIKNTDDNCTQIPVPLAASGLVFYPITTKNQLPSGGTTASINGIGSGSGTISTASDYQLRLTAPGGNKYGYVDVQLNAPPWLQYGGHPRTARATFGKSRTGPGIYMREIH